MAIIAANKSNLPMKKIIKSIDKIKPVNGRLEKVGNIKNNSKVILDYAHTPDALKTCLTNLREQFKLSKVSIVFGCGGERDKPKRQIMGKIVNDLCDRIYLTDDNPRKENPKKIRTQIKKKISKFKLFEIPSREIAISKAIKNLNSGDILLVAGKGHENYQEYFKKNFFSDKKCIIKNIQYKNKILLKNWKLNIIKEKLKKIKLNNNQKINLASINSKEIKKNDIFFGIKGKKLDGNRYANEAIKNGAALAIIDKNYGGFNSKKIKVNNTLNFLSNCSNLVRKASKIKAIAITGSSGKTSLKELLSQCLNKIASTSYSKKSFNNKFGVPISLFNIQKNNIFGVFEVGMDKKGEINHLTKLIMPDLGVITNISYAHIRNFKNLYEIALAKSEMINNIVSGGSIVLNKDDKFFNFLKNRALKKKLKVIVFAEDVAASGGYLIACAGDEIYANSSSIIGSIGVIYSSFGFKDLIKKIGVERRIYTAGKSKSTLDPFVEEKKEDIERLKNIQLDLHKDFINVVEESRGSKLKKDSEIELFSGEFWSGKKAKDLGLIDGIGNADQILRKKFGEKVVIKKFEKTKGWLAKKLSSSENQMDQLVNILEERSIWQRYGF